MSDSDEEDGGDTAAALNSIVAPLRKQLKKASSKVDKLNALVKALEDERNKESERREELEKQMAEVRATSTQVKTTLEANPWRFQGEQVETALRAAEKRLTDSLDEQRVQLAAHSQVFQSTQSTVSQLSQTQAALQAEQNDGARRNAEDVRSLTARLDHMRGEFSERMSHSYSESTTHADRLGQRLQEDLHRLDQELSLRAQSKAVADSQASLQSEVHELRTANDELRREVRQQATLLQELKDTQSGFALKSSLAGNAATSEQRLQALEESVVRMDTALRETGAALSEGKFGQRQTLIETRQVRLERELKQLEAKITSCGDELALRPLKTDVISAIAQQELAVEACAPKDAVEKLESALGACAAQSALAALEDKLGAANEQLSSTAATLLELRESAASKAALAQRGKELESLRTRLDEKLGRDECAGMLNGKLDKVEARSLLQAQEQLSGQVVGADAHARRLQDALSTTTNQALDAQAQLKQLSARHDRLSSLTSEIDGRLNQRKNELASLTKVVRLILDDAEMRCAIDEAEGATAAEATDVLQRLRGVSHRGNGGPMTISGVTLHKQAGGQLRPMPPGAAAADKVWYKSTLQPRTEVLGARRRMLVNARHSWVGDACLARGETDSSSRSSYEQRTPHMGAGGGIASSGCECMLTPSSTGAPVEPPA